MRMQVRKHRYRNNIGINQYNRTKYCTYKTNSKTSLYIVIIIITTGRDHNITNFKNHNLT